ncbi:MAG: SMC family ATPase [Candidatus Woesearchaeota archaeon]
MLLRQLKLQNIRSYLDQTIDLPSGSILLSGDIGSGKSTILLAIEFALFGLSKPDIPGEALLRKGTTQGSVELSFTISSQNETKEVTIKRTLKKDKDSVKQTTGYLIVNQVKKELTPVELKAEIINLLGYPEELISKNRNYIFRYTLYTPQEEMKLILQDNPEERLDVLRKIFNIDKYKNIRDNLQNYLKQMRSNLAVLEAKIEPLETQNKQLQELTQEKEQVQLRLNDLVPKLEQLRSRVLLQQQELDQLELKQKYFVEKQQQLVQSKMLWEEKKEQLAQLGVREEFLQKQILALELSPNVSLEQIRMEIKEFELTRNEALHQESTLKEKILQLRSQITELQTLIKLGEEEITQISDKEKQIEQLEQQIKLKEELGRKKIEVEHQLEENSNFITKNILLLSQSRELQKKILSLSTCPTCLQEVPMEHKQRLSGEEQEKSVFAEKKLRELEQIHLSYKRQKDEILQQIETILKAENQLTRLKVEVKHLQQKRNQLEQQRELVRTKVQENNRLMQEQETLQRSNFLEQINQKISQAQELAQKLAQKQYLELQAVQIKQQHESTSLQVNKLNQSIHSTEEELAHLMDLTKPIQEQKGVLKGGQAQEKEVSILQAQLQTQLDHLNRQELPLKQMIESLTLQKEKLLRSREIYHWLEDHFLPLTYTIEKQMMLTIHRLFNRLFQEWFGLLIEDENVYSKIDENFTPIIEQNGYEISFSNLSGGEKTSCALAYRLALNKVINDVIHEIKTKDLLILDEPTDGFSSEQLDKVREVLDRLHLKQVLIVSHESKIETFVEKVIRVSKNGHVSEVG